MLWKVVTALILTCICVTLSAQPAGSKLQSPPLTPDQLTIYRSFLDSYNNGSGATLNVANTTEKFAPSKDDLASCLKGFSATQTTIVHRLSEELVKGLKVSLVDPRLHEKRDPGTAIRQGQSVEDAVRAGFAAGIFTFSEIIFNADHTKAAFSYSFVCGGLCGNGGIVVYALKNGKWVVSNEHCSQWVS